MSASPSPGAAGLPWKNILLTTDFSADSITAWEQAKCLASLEPMAITVLHVTEPPFEGLRIHTETAHEEMRQAATTRLEEMVEKHFGGHSQVTARVEQGRAASVIGVEGRPVLIEAALLSGLPAFTVVGLPDAAVTESRERIRSAFAAAGVTFPQSRMTVNLSPACSKGAQTTSAAVGKSSL